MSAGLAALLDDVAAIARVAAASVDDVAAAAGKAGTKAVGVVVDDTAVTPGYALGFTPDRELPIVFKIALGSLKNKFFFLLPGALLLSAFAPWAVTPLLMLGGAYLCYEAAEKIVEAVTGHEPEADAEHLALGSAELEAEKVSGAIRTDLILSAEITAIALADVADRPLAIQAAALAVVALAITVGVYGAVALIVKMDDIGLHMAARTNPGVQRLGRGIVRAMPVLLKGLAQVGTVAMLWVGGGIIVHALHEYHLEFIPHLVDVAKGAGASVPGIGPVTGWVAMAGSSALFGLLIGAALVCIMHLVHLVKPKH